MFLVLSSIPMGRRHHANTRIRGLKEATAVIYLRKHEDDSFSHGVGILYPDKEHSFLAKSTSFDAKQLWCGMYATSRLSCLSDSSLAAAISIADESVPIDHPQFTSENCCLLYEYDKSPAKLREETFAKMKDAAGEIKKIIKGFKHWNLSIDDPYAKKVAKKQEAEVTPEKGDFISWGLFPQMTGIGTESLSLGI